ncbi:Phosphatidylinositol/phosphatidylcholine transfer protein SFH13 [Zea mays]|uniref:Phosphatidylinositol/phosphatidylcholine transfer protein SFH13 n=1 Tax=Zea mays TaxID=4577 RepID=A0A1D6QKC6_MAIZE|nr:Phosphatidylinositol/phosphatidylcholine transfer protein SFH13 [Zea mays]
MIYDLGRRIIITSDDAAADGDAVGDGELADLDAGILRKPDVEFPDGGGEPAVEVAERRVGGKRHSTGPQRVVVHDGTPDAHQAEQLLVVPDVVRLVGVDEGEVEGAVVGRVGEELVQLLQRRALPEVHLARHPGALDEGAADVVVLAAHVECDDLAVGGQRQSRRQQRVAREHAHLQRPPRAAQLDQHPQQRRLVRGRLHEPPLVLVGHQPQLTHALRLVRQHRRVQHVLLLFIPQINDEIRLD